jgi:hypothetical protein
MSRTFKMLPLAQLVPALPGMAGPKTYAAWPVWHDSTTAAVKYQPLPKKNAVALYHKARRFERQTRQPGRQDGALGRNGLAVLHALIFDILNYASGRLEPGYAKIAEKACISRRSVARGLANLKAAGVLHWVRRCVESWKDGRFCLEQQSNAYAILPASQWRGYWELPEPPMPHPTSWGATPPLPDQLTQAVADRQAGDSERAVLARLADDPSDGLACALAGLFGPILAAKP